MAKSVVRPDISQTPSGVGDGRLVAFTKKKKVHRSVQGYGRADEWDSGGATRGFTVCRLSGKSTKKRKKENWDFKKKETVESYMI